VPVKLTGDLKMEDRTAIVKRRKQLQAEYEIGRLLEAVEDGRLRQIELEFYLWEHHLTGWVNNGLHGTPNRRAIEQGEMSYRDLLIELGIDLSYDEAYEMLLARRIAEGKRTQEEVDALIHKNREQYKRPTAPDPDDVFCFNTCSEILNGRPDGAGPEYRYETWLAETYPDFAAEEEAKRQAKTQTSKVGEPDFTREQRAETYRLRAEYEVELVFDAVEDGSFRQAELEFYLWSEKGLHQSLTGWDSSPFKGFYERGKINLQYALVETFKG